MKILLKGFEQQQILKFAKEMHFPALWSRTKILQLSKSYICYSPAKVGLYQEKLCPRSWYTRQRAQFFPIRTDLGWCITFLFFCEKNLKDKGL